MPKAQALPEKDIRATSIRQVDTPCDIAIYRSRDDWRARAAQLRLQILAGAGLLPLPEKTPLKTKIFARTERDGYSIEKAYFESSPGFFVTGNLYRPRGKKGPFPGILCPHGHWKYGRLEDSSDCSVPGRCINLARQGYVVFTYDMAGYNDSAQVHHGRLGAQREELWGVSLMGLQLWSSIRAVDFISSLPDVDAKRIGCTGASGGGTQTFLLAAVDDRISAAAPVNMISAIYQGGCICENGPNLRLDTNNLEIGAAMAPRPLLLVSASGDWTRNTPRVEYPWIRGIYKLFDAEDRIASAPFDAGHNYNQASREAVYQFFARHLLGARDADKVREQPFHVEQVRDLLVFFGEKYPGKRPDAAALTESLIERSKAQLDSAWPRDRASLLKFRRAFQPVFAAALAAELPSAADVIVEEGKPSSAPECTIQPLAIGRADKGDRVPAVLLLPDGAGLRKTATLIVSGQGKSQILSRDGRSAGPLARQLLDSGRIVLAIDCIGTGAASHPPLDAGDQRFTTYNRTELASRVQDILTAVVYLEARDDVSRIELVGLDQAGPWCLLARGLAHDIEACAADVQRFDLADDAQFVTRLFIPLLRRAGDFRTAVALAAPRRLMVFNTGARFDTAAMSRLYSGLGAAANFTSKAAAAAPAQIARFLSASP